MKDYIVQHIEESNELEEESSNISQYEDDYNKPAAKLWPDLDLDKVMVNKRAQFNEFVKMYSAFVSDDIQNHMSNSRSRKNGVFSK